jgi:BirA family biotin operon repressor/biotin-[acetyl-CoA-carboxylase] ligase
MKNFDFQEVLFTFDTIPSTNEEAKRKVLQSESGNCFAILSKMQTDGRGRLKRIWNSSFEGNIYLTIALNENLCIDVADILPLYTAFVVLIAIGEKAQYKWVNDIIIQNKKVGGVLIEKINKFFIIGIGINVVNNPKDTIFPSANLNEFDLNVSAEQIFDSFKNNINTRREFIINYLQSKFFTQDEVSINQGEFVGNFYKITNNGNLIIKTADGKLKEITFGDVGVI